MQIPNIPKKKFLFQYIHHIVGVEIASEWNSQYFLDYSASDNVNIL